MDGVEVLTNKTLFDDRGSFVKTFSHAESHLENIFPLCETFRTKSLRGVVRGFHLQIGISANYRIIQILSGCALEVLLDLRKNSNTYGQFLSFEINATDTKTLIVPPGVAHGFQALEECHMLYVTSTPWDPENDTGVHPLDSGFSWPLHVENISLRDSLLPPLQKFQQGHMDY